VNDPTENLEMIKAREMQLVVWREQMLIRMLSVLIGIQFENI